MKRHFIIPLCVVAAVAASCTIEEQSPVAAGGSRMTLTGDSYTATKVSIGEKDGETYPLLWFTGDAISINSTDGTFSGEIADLYSGSSGQVSGFFQTSKDLVPASDMDIVVLYPGYSLTYNKGVITGNVPSEQTQRSANSSIHVGTGCFAYAETSVEAGQKEGVKFSLQHKTAFVKVVVKMDEYSGYYLSGISFSSEGASLSGDVSYDMNTGEMTVKNAESSVNVSISNTSLLSSEQEVYFTVIPCDLTGQQVFLSIKMTNDTGNVEVPLYIDGGDLKESCLTIIKIDGAADIPAWYEPEETRDLLGGWAYGAQNTYIVEGGKSITIDVRARGDFTKVREPKYYGLLTHSSSYGYQDEYKLCYLPNGISYSEETPTNEVSDDCTITVSTYENSSDYANWAVVGLYDEDYNIIWSFMIWKYNTGDEPTGVEYPGGFVLLDRNLGAPYSNSVAAEKGTFTFPHAYFQWGRKDAFPWNQITTYDVKSAPEGFSIFDSVSEPTFMYVDSTNGEYKVDWKEGRFDLWGGEDNTWSNDGVSGHKTVFDPCPEGWRVPDAWAMNYVWNNLEHWEIRLEEKYTFQQEGWINEDSPFYKAGESTFACKLSDGSYDYWPFAGFQWLSRTDKYSNNTGLKSFGAAYPANGATTEKRSMGFHLIYYSGGSGLYTDYVEPFWGSPVRCQKEN